MLKVGEKTTSSGSSPFSCLFGSVTFVPTALVQATLGPTTSTFVLKTLDQITFVTTLLYLL
jgi:hypothetical protein